MNCALPTLIGDAGGNIKIEIAISVMFTTYKKPPSAHLIYYDSS